MAIVLMLVWKFCCYLYACMLLQSMLHVYLYMYVNPRVALQCTVCVCVCVLYVQAYNGHFGVLEELLYKYQAYLDCKDEKGKCHFQLVHTHCQTMQLEL